MGIRTSKYLIQSVLILFCFQLLGTIFVSQEAEEQFTPTQSVAFQKHSAPTALNALFEKTEKETEEEKHDKFFSFALIDFSLSFCERLFSIRLPLQFSVISQHTQEISLRIFHSTFLI
jgi:hypothetical protein